MKVRIGPYDFDLKTVDKGTIDNNRGVIRCTTQELLIAKDLPQRMHEATCHEIMHGLHWVWLQRMGDDRINMTEERLTENEGIGLSALIKDNPKLFQWLRKYE